MVLVDTSVWIDFLRGKGGASVETLKLALEEGEASLCEIIFAEICFGAQAKKQLAEYEAHFSQIPFLNLPEGWHYQVGRMGHSLRMAGYKPFIADLIIGFLAVRYRVPLLTTDKDFLTFEKLFGLKLHEL